MNKEQRAEQMTMAFASALKSLELGIVDDIVLVPFSSNEKVEVIRTMSDGNIITTVINAPF
jgi:hypothetical protein